MIQSRKYLQAPGLPCAAALTDLQLSENDMHVSSSILNREHLEEILQFPVMWMLIHILLATT